MIDYKAWESLIKLVAAVFLKAKRSGRPIFARMENDLTVEQLWTLMMISENNSLNVKELADSYARENTTTTRMIDGLERLSLVVRVPDQLDRRQKRICLTHAGRQRVEETRALFTAFSQRMVNGIDVNDMEIAKSVMRKILNNLSSIAKSSI